MCRLFLMTNLTKMNNEQKEQLIKIAQSNVTRYNRDGFGFTSLQENTMFTYKSLNCDRINLDTSDKLAGLVPDQSIQSSIFDISTIEALMAHGRTSTNRKGLDYCHPFNNQDNTQSFIHNGVIQAPNMETLEPINKRLKTQNDSELLANIFWKKGVQGLDDVFGYYAFININSITREITIIKDDRAQLYVGYSNTYESYIFATDKEFLDKIDPQVSYERMLDNKIVVIKDNVIKSINNLETNINKNSYQLTKKEQLAFKDYDNLKSDYKFLQDNWIDDDDFEIQQNALAQASKKQSKRIYRGRK